jgi:intein/homing endonuclease
MRPVYNDDAVKLLMLCGRQIGKTVILDSPILMSNGKYKLAKDIELNEGVASLNTETQKLVTSHINWKSEIYSKPCLRIETRLGHIIDVATTHPVRTWNYWTEAANLSVGDRIATVRKAGDFNTSTRYSDEEITILAGMLGDGYFDERQCCFSQARGALLEDYKRCLETLGVNIGILEKKSHVRVAHVYLDIITEGNLRGTKSATKFIPDFVFEFNKEQTALFINRLWATDGHVKKSKESQYDISYASMSVPLIRGLQALLWKFGIPSRIRQKWPSIYKKRGEKKYSYELRVETQKGVTTFLTEIGAIGKSEGVPLPTSSENNNRDTFPREINHLIKEAYTRNRGWRDGERENSFRQDDLRITLKYAPTTTKIQQYIAYFKKDNPDSDIIKILETHCDSDVYWDKIVSITDLGEKECVDFSVSNTANYVVNGVITHNSTTLCNFLATEMMSIPQFKTLYVSPSKEQTSRFSNTRFAKCIHFSPLIQKHYIDNRMPSNNVMLRMLANGSEITFSYAADDATRIRGVSADRLCLDEAQSIVLPEVEPVLRECLAASKYKYRSYVGTPLSMENDIEVLWQKSTKNEWIVTCVHCAAKNMVTERNMGDKFLMCLKCFKELDVRYGEWYAFNPNAEVVGYHISQLVVYQNVSTIMNPITKELPYNSILEKRKDYTRAKFNNEVLGISDSIGTRLISLEQLRDLCKDYAWSDTQHSNKDIWKGITQTVCGIDWGGQGLEDYSRTVITVLGILPDHKMRLMYTKIFPSGNPVADVEECGKIAETYRCAIIIGDEGNGALANGQLRQKLGHHRVFGCRYVGMAGGGGGSAPIKWNNRNAYHADRTTLIDQVFQMFLCKGIEFPQYHQAKPIIDDIMAEFEETTPQGRRVWRHAHNVPDDSLHALVFSWLAVKVVTGTVSLYQNDEYQA